MSASGLFLLASTAGILHFVPRMGIQVISATSEVKVAGQSFIRVEKLLNWYEARDYCRIHHTDLANLESLKGPGSLMSLYSILKSEAAWIGLFFNVKTGTLSWASGPVFTSAFWFPSLSGFMPEVCALLKVIVMQTIPAAVTGHCSTQNAFICYYDPAIGHLNTEQYLPRNPTTPLSSVEVKIDNQNFIRIVGEQKPWSAAQQYCHKHYTDLANLQSVTDGAALKSITSEIQAWIGLYFDECSGSLKWSSNFGSSIPSWLLTPMFGPRQCATLTRFSNNRPQISAAFCSDPKPFICFYDPSITLLPHRESLLSSSSVSLQSDESDTTLGPGDSTTSNCVTTTDWELSTAPGHMSSAASSEPTGSWSGLKTVTTQASSSGSDNIASGASDSHLTITSRPTTRLGSTRSQPESEPGSSSVTGKKEGETSQGLLASSEPPGSPLFPRGGDSTTSNSMTVSGQELSTAPGHMPSAASSEPTGSWLELKTVTSQASGTDNIAPGASDPHLTITSRPTTRLGPTQSQSELEPGSSSFTGKKVGGTSKGFLISSELPGSPLSPRGEQRFGILKADFNSPDILQSEARKEELLREIHEAVKAILGHEQFRLKWISFDENQS